MLLHSDKEKFEHFNSITHEGKVLLVATAADGALWYSVKQDGFEDSYLHADPAHRTGWEKWRELPLPGRRKDEHGNWKDEKDPYDQSVIDKEKEEFAVPKGSDDLIIRSRYKTYDQSAIAPVQLVSGLGHLYIFRQSKSGTLLVDRFVLDGMTNELVRKLEVRFKRSGQKYKPLQSTQDGKPGKLAKLVSVDSLDFRDANNLPFYEPTTELSLIRNLYQGWFSVVLVPTTAHDIHRWHLFMVTGTSSEKQVEIISIQSSKEGLFDVSDHFVAHPRPTTVSGIVRRTIALKASALKDTAGKVVELHPANGIAATKYDIQTERETEDGPQLLREATRIMLAIPTEHGTAALSFAVATDGTLSRIDESPNFKELRATKHEIMLPLNTLDEIKTIGDSTPLQGGQITALRRNEEDDRVVVTSSTSNLEKLGIGDLVKIEGTVSYDGHYDQVKEPVKDDAFGIDVKPGTPGSMGKWTKLEKEETGLVFDGIITGLQRKGEVIEVTSPGHGLSAGSEVQIDATHDFNGVYQVASIDGAEFTIERKWQPGASINLKREADKRRGIQFNDAQAHIETPPIELDDPASGKPCGATYSAWVFVPSSSAESGGTADRLLVTQKDPSVQLCLSSGHMVLKVNLTGGIEKIEDPDPIPQGKWVHYAAAVVSSIQKGTEALNTTLVLCRNGVEVSSSEPRAGTVVSHLTKMQAKQGQIAEEEKSYKSVEATREFYEKESERAKLKATFIWTGYGETHPHEYGIGTRNEMDINDWGLGGGKQIPEGLIDTYFPGCGSYQIKTIGGNTDAEYIEKQLKDHTDKRNNSARNLESLKKQLKQLADLERDWKTFRIGGDPTADAKNAGPLKIADAQIWNKARTPQEIEDSMYLTLTGQEIDLAGYWRMGGIVPGEPRTVVDFSVQRSNATVHGDAFVAAKTLSRSLAMKIGDKTVPATEYINEELFAVSQRAKYIETFEFRVDQGDAEPASDLFTFAYWGKRSRGAEERIPMEAGEPTFKPATAGGGWYAASCSFIVPDGVTLVRSFGISKVTGDYWDELHVRKHRITCVSDCITEERLADPADLTTLANDQDALEDLKELDRLEKEQVELLRDKRDLETQLRGGESKLIKDKQDQITKEEKSSKSIKGKCEFWKKESERAKLKATFIWTGYGETHPHEYGIGTRNEMDINDWGLGGGKQIPEGLIDTYFPGCGSYQIKTIGGNTDAGHIKRQLKHYTDKGNSSFRKLGVLRRELAALENIQRMSVNARKERLKKVISELAELTAKLETRSWQVLKDIDNARQHAHKMSTLPKNEHKDSRGLETKGALLGFVHPASRISALETCEGNVQLSYFDADRRMRQANYDATADSANSRFEQWLPNGLRSCINFNQSRDPLALPEEKQIVLLEDWTIEAWVSFPLALLDDHEKHQQKSWRALAGSVDGRDGYIVAEYDPLTRKELLGIRVKGKFQGSGYDLADLDDGWHHLAAVAKVGATVFYIDGTQVGSYPLPEKLEQAKKIEKESSSDARDLAVLWQDLAKAKNRKDEKSIDDLKTKVEELEKKPQVKAQANNIKAAKKEASAPQPSEPITMLGKTTGSEPFGKVAELRIWIVALTAEEIEVNSKTLLSGNEPGLLAYYPMDEASGTVVRDQTRKGYNWAFNGKGWWGCAAPIGLADHQKPAVKKFDGAVSAEYSTISQDPKTGRRASMMRRCLAYPSPDGIAVLADKRIEELELVWVGNTQFAPTLLGYIEGAPPVPSENLTEEDDYNGATSVELAVSEDVTFSWNRSKEVGWGSSAELFAGADADAKAGLGVLTKLFSSRAGVKGNVASSNQQQHESNITASSAVNKTDKLELRGTPETEPKFPHLGNRFIPKNVGYALVVSALADVFITRLARSKKMIGYQTLPVGNIPPDVNTITFLMNPTYTMAGSLDGMTGTSATSDRFFKHVPEMRAQYGSLYPASYYRLQEAYDLKQQITLQDKTREAYFAQFNAGIGADINDEIYRGAAPGEISVTRAEDKPEKPLTDAERKKAEEEAADKAQRDAAESSAKQNEALEQKRTQINTLIEDQDKRQHAMDKLEKWQTRMQDIMIRAAKRNLVNTYIWDADGGLRAEAQSFANTVEHTIGGAFAMDAALGGEGKFVFGGVAVELTAQATTSLTETMSKTESRGTGIGLNVDLGGVEYKAITDHNDYPLMPGEKVDRYRFMSFYLEGSTRNFNDFFDYVVDPEWLASNDEEARALRQAMGKANKTWRVLHRVTYVERPALMGFGRDLRSLASAPKEPSDIQKLTDRMDKSEEMLKSIINSLKELQRKS